jgi:hypothetical protein
MPDKAASYASGKKAKGPAGTASQRATKQGKIKGRESTASKKTAMGNKLPDNKGT